jgi:outer membrane receptor protein involved in Fe transport
MRALRPVALAILLTLTLHAWAAAQVTTGDIVGRVMDSSGAVLPGVTVTVENAGTRDVRTTVTTETGDYVVNLLPIGNYVVRIELAGFQTQESRVALRSGERIRVEGRLQLGSLTETVQVTAETPLLQTDSATMSTLVTESEVQDLPVNGRNFIRLIQLVPGANEGASNALGSGNRPDDRRQTSAVSINGAGDNQNNMLIDGMDNNERAIGTIGVRPSMDAIAEVRVQTNNYAAEVGRTAGGVVNLLTKAGTNVFHGSAYGFFRDDRFDSRDFFAREDPILKQKQFGGSFGGPLVANRTFFFSDYEGFRQRKGQVNVLTVPTLAMRGGDFSGVADVIYDPFTRQPFAGNRIPAERIDPIAARYIALFPEPTSAGLANNYSSTTLRTQNSTTADGRIDHRFDDSNSVWGRYSYNDSHTVTPPGCPPVDGVFGNCLTGANAGFPGPNDTDASALQVNYVRIFNSTTVGEFKGGYMKVGIFSYPSNYQTNLSQRFGLPGVNIDDLASGLALQNIAGFALLGDTQNIPLITKDLTQQYHASITKATGSHSFKFGGGVILREFSVTQSQQPNGLWTFNNQVTRSAAGTGGHALASFLLGLPSQVQRSHTPFEPFYHVTEPSMYAQDDWRATSWLTLNLGIRYDVFTPFTEEENRLSNLDLSIPRVLVAGQDGVSRTAGVKTDWSNVGPRLGFAATLSDSMVLRGGYGMTYLPGNIASFAYMKNAPLFSIYGPVISNGTLLNGTPNLFLRDGLPPPPAAPSIDPALVSGAFRVVDPDFRSTRVQQFNVQLEKEFMGNVIAAGYVGSRGDFVAMNPDINQAPPGAGAIQPRRRFASTLPQLAQINVFQSIYESWYDALQVVFQRRLNGGLSFNTHYRLAHAQQTQPVNWDGLQVERIDAPRDMRHSWVGQINYALPWGRSLTGVAHGLLAGWQVNAIATYQTGEPFGVTNLAGRANTGGAPPAGQGLDRPDLVGNPELPKSERTVARWFNTDAFQPQALFTLGTAPAVVMHGPSQRRLDLSVFKDLAVGSSARLQLRYEVYNVTNVVNFQNPVSTLGSPDFGSITSTGNSTPRQMQFAVRLMF